MTMNMTVEHHKNGWRVNLEINLNQYLVKVSGKTLKVKDNGENVSFISTMKTRISLKEFGMTALQKSAN